VFVDQADSTDMNMADAFRHEIHVPVDPDAWLDAKVEEVLKE
jgi:hypothetical protein